MQVLIVDDDGDTRDLLREILTDEGYQVTTAPDGWAALGYLWMTASPMVVLVDERLPGLTGSQVVEEYLQAGAPTSPREFIIMTTSLDLVVTPRNGRMPVVSKPFALETLLQMVAQAAARLESQ